MSRLTNRLVFIPAPAAWAFVPLALAIACAPVDPADASVRAQCRAARPPAPHVVDIVAPDGLVLKGTLLAAAAAGPAVLLLHRCDDQRKVWDPLGTRLAAAGITALSFDYRGYGESGGAPYDRLSNDELTRMMATKWPGDIDAAFAFLAGQTGVKMERVAGSADNSSVSELHLPAFVYDRKRRTT